MTQGKMTCLGSTMFLKSRFGVGYVMTVVKNNPIPNEKIIPYMKDRLGPDICKLTEIQGEMTIQIPREYTILFKDFFTDFDFDLGELDIQTYGISVTTLEQVFLEIGHDPNPKPKVVAAYGSDDDDSVDLDRPEDAGIDNDYGEATPGLFTNPSRRTPGEGGGGQFAKVSPMPQKDMGIDMTDEVAIPSERLNINSTRKLLDKPKSKGKGKGKDEDSQQVSFLPSVSGLINQDKGKFDDIDRSQSHHQSQKSLLENNSVGALDDLILDN